MHSFTSTDSAIDNPGDAILVREQFVLLKVATDKEICSQHKAHKSPASPGVMAPGALSQKLLLVHRSPGRHGDDDQIDDFEAKIHCMKKFELKQQSKDPIRCQKCDEFAQRKEQFAQKLAFKAEIHQKKETLCQQLPQRCFQTGGYAEKKNSQPEIEVLAVDQA